MVVETCASALVTAAVGKKIIENILNDLCEMIKKNAKNKLIKFSIKSKSSDLQKQIRNIRMVKTLWQIDKAVDIKSFYCDSNIIENSKRKIVRNISDFNTKENILVEGIAGQGKSIFLRYLCSTTLSVSGKIPIFIELRKISSTESLIEHICRYLEVLDINIDEDVFKELARSGKFTLFLDGFDEVSLENKGKIISEIEHIGKVCNELQIIITSRPHTGIEMIPQFTVVKLDNLKNDEYKNVINKLSACDILASNLINQINHNKAKIKELLCTPLMVTLLLISYKSYQEIPEQLSDFYDSLFQLLLQRHDGVKPGYKRHRCCSINDHQYREIFEGLCLESKHKPVLSYSFEDIYKFTESSLDNLGISEDPAKFIDDIVKVTCLILKEGGEYKFIHRSLQEYYAASCIRRKPESVAVKFYNHCLNNNGYHGIWSQELQFLSEIDKYRYTKYFIIPLCMRILMAKCSDIDAINVDDIDKCMEYIFKGCKFRFSISPDRKEIRMISMTVPLMMVSSDILLKEIFNANFIISKKIIDKYKDCSNKNIRYGCEIVMSIAEIIKHQIQIDNFRSVTVKIVDTARKELKKSSKYIEMEEKFDASFGVVF